MYMDETEGLSFTGDTSGSNLQFSGTRSALNAALATLHYSHDALGWYTIEATIVNSS